MVDGQCVGPSNAAGICASGGTTFLRLSAAESPKEPTQDAVCVEELKRVTLGHRTPEKLSLGAFAAPKFNSQSVSKRGSGQKRKLCPKKTVPA